MLTSLPLVSELRHPAMRPRHWMQLMKAQIPSSFDALLLNSAYCASGDHPCDGIEGCKSSLQDADGAACMQNAFNHALGCCRQQGCTFRWQRNLAWGTS